MRKLYVIFFILLFSACGSTSKTSNSSITKSVKKSNSAELIPIFYRGYCLTEKKFLNSSWNSSKKVAINDNNYHKRKHPKHKVTIERKH